jgi:thiamine-monophosphate kinase
MRVADIGEFPLIERLGQIIATERPDLLVGLGDDVAVLALPGDELLLATIDIQIERVHFLPELITPEQLGARALAINLSDIAAMGGQPWFALVSLALPEATEVEWLEQLYRGMRAAADRFGVAVVGGNISRARSDIAVDVALLGRIRREQLLTRAGAQPGDRVLVTGHLGEAAAGLQLARHPEFAPDPTDREFLLGRYLAPTPRVPEAALIAGQRQATAMIDLSDGLSSDIGHICEQSRVGVRIWAAELPIPPAVQQVAGWLNQPPWQLALAGGDDYELCFTAPAAAADELAALVARETGTPVTIVGEILPAEHGHRLLLADRQELPLEAAGWQHFRQ